MSGTKRDTETARQIYQDLLDRIARAYETDDFEDYARMIRIPHHISSYGPPVQLDTKADLRALFDNVRTHFANLEVTDYVRTCLSARFVKDDEIIGMHETRILIKTRTLEEPYPVQSRLRFHDDAWWVCESDNALEPERGFGRVLKKTRVDRGAAPVQQHSNIGATRSPLIKGEVSND